MTFKSFTIAILLTLIAVLPGPSQVSAQAEPAQIIFVPLFQDEGLTVHIYRDDTRIQVRVPPRMNTTPISVPAGEHTFRVTTIGNEQEVAAIESVRLQSDRTYLLVGSGAMSDGSAILDLIPVIWDDSEPKLVFMHHMADDRLLDLKIDSTQIFESIDGNTVAIQPIAAETLAYFEVVNSENGNIINDAGYEGIDVYPNLTYLAIQSRNRYLDVQPIYLEDPTIVNGGVIQIGSVSGTSLDVGTRVRYSLSLENSENLTISLESDADPYLRLYNANARLIASHDDLSNENLNASLEAVELAAGTYFIEIGSYADAFPGMYTLSVTRAR